jgi:cell division protein ZapA
MSRSTTVEILGQEYRVKGDSDVERIEMVGRYVDQKMRQLTKGSSLGSSTKVAILTALNIADELYEERQKAGDALREVDEQLQSMKALLEESLQK